MNISRITYFNIGNSADEGQDFFDVLKAGFAIFYGEEDIDGTTTMEGSKMRTNPRPKIRSCRRQDPIARIWYVGGGP